MQIQAREAVHTQAQNQNIYKTYSKWITVSNVGHKNVKLMWIKFNSKWRNDKLDFEKNKNFILTRKWKANHRLKENMCKQKFNKYVARIYKVLLKLKNEEIISYKQRLLIYFLATWIQRITQKLY